MITLLRKHNHFLMVLVTVMVIIAFVFLYNNTRFDELGRNRVRVLQPARLWAPADANGPETDEDAL